VKNDTIFNVLGTASLVTVAVLLYYLTAFRQKAEALQVHIITLDSLWYVVAGFLFHLVFFRLYRFSENLSIDFQKISWKKIFIPRPSTILLSKKLTS